MNKSIYLLVILFFGLISANNFAQPVFPLEEGNTWYYEITYEFYNPPQPPSYYTFQVVDDTLMPNGKTFWIFEPRDMFWGKYVRSDSAFVYYWDSNCNCEKQVFNINASIGLEDTINWAGYFSSTLSGAYQIVLFNESINRYNYNLGGLIYAEINLSERFGYTSFLYLGDYQWERDNWQLKGCIISDTLYGEMTDVPPAQDIPNKMQLNQNYPNPFNPSTKIRFTISDFGFTTLKVYDVLGNEVTTLVNEEKHPGVYEVEFNANELSSGIYFYQLKAGDFISIKKMILLR